MAFPRDPLEAPQIPRDQPAEDVVDVTPRLVRHPLDLGVRHRCVHLNSQLVPEAA